MTETNEVYNPMDIVVETNSAPVEQQSAEPVVTESLPEQTLDASEPIVEPEKAIDPKDNELAREKIRETLRADEYKRQLDQLKPKDDISDKEPDINDYNVLDEYKADYKKWAKEEGRREERASVTQAEHGRKQAELRANVAIKEQESRAKHTDYDSIVNPIVPVIASSPILKDFIAKNPMGTEVAYVLGNNPAILDQLTRLDVWEAGERLLGIAARLKKPVVAPVSNAPEPIKTVGSRETVKARLSAMSDGDFIKARNKQELARLRH